MGPGSYLQRSVDVFTWGGLAVLVNKEREALERDIATIRQMETDFTMFTLQEQSSVLGRPRSVSELSMRKRHESNASEADVKVLPTPVGASPSTFAVFCVGVLLGAFLGRM